MADGLELVKLLKSKSTRPWPHLRTGRRVPAQALALEGSRTGTLDTWEATLHSRASSKKWGGQGGQSRETGKAAGMETTVNTLV